MKKYISELNNLPSYRIIKVMERCAEKNKIPIISKEGLMMLLLLLDVIKPKRFLEIGTAIGYCAINVALHNEDIIVDTIEKNEELYLSALKYIDTANLNDRINVYHADALTFDITILKERFDIIFIDAAKAQYIKYFEIYKERLADNGLIITDNLLFHGLVLEPSKIINKDLRQLTEKIRRFNSWLAKNKDFQTKFFSIGDGMSISRRILK